VIDIGRGLAWFCEDSGNWNGSPSASPATGAGGKSFNISGPLFPLAFLQTGGTVKINSGNAAFAFSVPSGCSPWGV